MPVSIQNLRMEWRCESCGHKTKVTYSGSDAFLAPSCRKCGSVMELEHLGPKPMEASRNPSPK